MVIIIDLDELPSWRVANDVVLYCIENSIEPQKCFEFVNDVDYPGRDLLFNIPEKHITWMRLKGII